MVYFSRGWNLKKKCNLGKLRPVNWKNFISKNIEFSIWGKQCTFLRLHFFQNISPLWYTWYMYAYHFLDVLILCTYYIQRGVSRSWPTPTKLFFEMGHKGSVALLWHNEKVLTLLESAKFFFAFLDDLGNFKHFEPYLFFRTFRKC